MPIIQHSNYRPPLPFRWTHINTIYPALFRSLPALDYERETIKTNDGDNLELDWIKNGKDRLLISLHGLEGTSDRPYMMGMLRRFQSAGWDGLAFNFRSCAGQINTNLRSYNMGATADLHHLIKHVVSKGYKTITLVGFSLGGNLLLKYLGEGADFLPKEIKAAVAISVPCYIPTASIKIDQLENRVYLKRFMNTLNDKMTEKKALFPDHITLPKKMPKNFQEFDAYFTSRIHGYSNAMDYWEHCSSLHFLPNIRRPVLLINALDDTFLSKECYPFEQARESKFFHLETPRYGGHCGFYTRKNNKFYWTEDRALAFSEAAIS